jgi:hypothetical protein
LYCLPFVCCLPFVYCLSPSWHIALFPAVIDTACCCRYGTWSFPLASVTLQGVHGCYLKCNNLTASPCCFSHYPVTLLCLLQICITVFFLASVTLRGVTVVDANPYSLPFVCLWLANVAVGSGLILVVSAILVWVPVYDGRLANARLGGLCAVSASLCAVMPMMCGSVGPV